MQKNEKQIKNGNMIDNMKELIEHSKVMERMLTNKQVRNEEKQPDPKQYTHKE